MGSDILTIRPGNAPASSKHTDAVEITWLKQLTEPRSRHIRSDVKKPCAHPNHIQEEDSARPAGSRSSKADTWSSPNEGDRYGRTALQRKAGPSSPAVRPYVLRPPSLPNMNGDVQNAPFSRLIIGGSVASIPRSTSPCDRFGTERIRQNHQTRKRSSAYAGDRLTNHAAKRSLLTRKPNIGPSSKRQSKSSPFDSMHFLYQKKLSLRLRSKEPVPSS